VILIALTKFVASIHQRTNLQLQ